MLAWLLTQRTQPKITTALYWATNGERMRRCQEGCKIAPHVPYVIVVQAHQAQAFCSSCGLAYRRAQ